MSGQKTLDKEFKISKPDLSCHECRGGYIPQEIDKIFEAIISAAPKWLKEHPAMIAAQERLTDSRNESARKRREQAERFQCQNTKS
jgi:hypothetical protein